MADTMSPAAPSATATIPAPHPSCGRSGRVMACTNRQAPMHSAMAMGCR